MSASSEEEEETCVRIKSTYADNVELFNNGSEESFSDIDFYVTESSEPLKLHRNLLAKASSTLFTLFIMKQNAYGNFDERTHKVTWVFKRSETDPKYREILVKWLRFCYGEDQVFNVDDCPTAYALFAKLQIKHKSSIEEQLIEFMGNTAEEDALKGVILLDRCISEEQEMAEEEEGGEMKNLIRRIAQVLFTEDNMEEYYDAIVSDCLLDLPEEFLDNVEYGEPHTKLSEFNIRCEYVLRRKGLISKEKMHEIVFLSKDYEFSSVELRKLYEMKLISDEQMIRLCFKTLEAKEKDDEVLKPHQERIVDFFYTGGKQTFIAKRQGRYKLEVWGAQGGENTYGGKGAYATGTIKLTKKQIVEVFVGGQGSANSTSSIGAGGYNGGGCAAKKNSDNFDIVCGGGGASDFRVGGTALENRVIVAGGGGGGVSLSMMIKYRESSYYYPLTDGRSPKIGLPSRGPYGGYAGGSGVAGHGSFWGERDRYGNGDGGPGSGATTSKGGFGGGVWANAQSPGSNGAFGVGGNGGAGGGGGYYGGGGSCVGCGSTGGGGSSYTGGVTDSSVKAGNESFMSPKGTIETGHTGNGHARITFLGK